jgi:GrpB-like predicted nucleotidyltransferase (UPF0157 family)
MTEARIVVVDYDPSWPEQFASEKAVLEPLLAPFRSGPIEHIGSTAVVGLCAKPVIDIMVGVPSLASSEPAKDLLRGVGYHYAAYKTDVMHWFCKPSLALRTHHLHLVPFGSPLWQQRLVFRNSLRADPQLASDYAALKRRLALEFEHDREAYTDAKSPFVMRVLGAARRSSE